MANTTSWTTQDLTNIETMIAKGITRARFDNQELSYRSIAEMIQVRQMIQAALGLTGTRQRQVLPRTGF